MSIGLPKGMTREEAYIAGVADGEGSAMMPRTISIEMTWQSQLPRLLVLFADGDSEGKALALAELRRMAKLADEYKALRQAALDFINTVPVEPGPGWERRKEVYDRLSAIVDAR